MGNLNFTAIDFETATCERSSICEIGITVVRNSEIISSKSWLVKPPNNEYDGFNTYIHGITPAMTKHSPSFSIVWKEVLPYLEENVVVAHNTGFDMYALRDALLENDIPFPKFDYYCSYRIARYAIDNCYSYSLPNVCEALEIKLDSHHRAEADSKACAEVVIASILFFCPSIKAQDWPQFLGPDRDSKSPQKGLLRSWPEEGPEVLWAVEVGVGYGGPVVKNGKAYLLDRDEETGDIMRCFNLQTGEELWRYSYDAPGDIPFPGSRSVPVVDDRHVYSCGPYGDLYCFDVKTGKPVWQKNVWTDFGGKTIPLWAISQCPVLYGDLLIVASQAPEAGVVAYNKQTGDVVWKTPNLGNESYVSPKILKIHGEDQVVWLTSSTNTFQNRDAEVTKGNVVGLDPHTGKTLWQYSNWDCHISVACPVVTADNKLLIIGGYERGATMIQINKKANGSFDTTELFTTLEFGDQTKPPLYHDGHFYAMYRTNQKRDGLVCMDMEGNIKWKTGRNPNFDRGSMILADGLLLTTDGLKTLYLIEPSPEAFKMISKADVLTEGGAGEGMARMGGSTQNWAPIALADGKLLIRDQAKMVCVKVVQ